MNTQAIDIFFYIFATIGSLFAFRVITAANPISGAFSLVMTFFCVAAVYALMDAHFIAAIQILVYAGAVMVLFIFVIMLLNADVKVTEFGKGMAHKTLASTLCVAIFAGVVWCVRHGEIAISHKEQFTSEKINELGGNARVVSELMFSNYILPFELTSVLLLVGIVGSVALAKRSKKVKS